MIYVLDMSTTFIVSVFVERKKTNQLFIFLSFVSLSRYTNILLVIYYSLN